MIFGAPSRFTLYDGGGDAVPGTLMSDSIYVRFEEALTFFANRRVKLSLFGEKRLGPIFEGEGLVTSLGGGHSVHTAEGLDMRLLSGSSGLHIELELVLQGAASLAGPYDAKLADLFLAHVHTEFMGRTVVLRCVDPKGRWLGQCVVCGEVMAKGRSDVSLGSIKGYAEPSVASLKGYLRNALLPLRGRSVVTIENARYQLGGAA